MKTSISTNKYTATERELAKYQYKSFTTSFVVLKHQPNKHKRHWIYVEVEINYVTQDDQTRIAKRIRKRYNTGILIPYNKWYQDQQQTKDIEINNSIQKYRYDLERNIETIIKGEDFKKPTEDIKELQRLFATGVEKKRLAQKSIIEYLEDYYEHRRKKGTPRGTLKEFKSCRNRIEKYQNKRGVIVTLESINLTFADDLLSFLSDEKYHPNTMKKTFEILKTCLNFFYSRRDEMHITLSDKFKLKEFGAVKEYETTPIPLNDIEIKLIQDYNFDTDRKKALKELAMNIKKGKIEKIKEAIHKQNIETRYQTMLKTRKQMLLQMTTGLRVSDLFTIKPSDVHAKHISLQPVKTMNTKDDNTIIIPLNTISREVLKSIGYDSSKLKTSSQNYNVNIKELLKIVGIDNDVPVYEHKGLNNRKKLVKKKCDVLTSHNLRDTFISKAIRMNKSIPALLKATGQSSYEVLKKYIRLETTDVVDQLGDLF